MGAVSSWLLSIAGVIILSVLAEFVLPDGQINRYIKVIFSFVTLLVIILPLPNLFGKEFDLSKFFGSESENLQENYLYQLNLDKLTALQKDITDDISKSGLKNVKVSINANILEEDLKILSIYVDLCEIEYADNFENKNIQTAKTVIREILDDYSILNGVEVQFNE